MASRSTELSAELGERDLDDVLLDDVPLRDGDVLLGAAAPAAQPAEGAAPGQREGASERRLHRLPTRHLGPLPRLALQTLDALQQEEEEETERSCERLRTTVPLQAHHSQL